MSRQLKTLFKVNLLYLNPQYTQKLRKKDKTSKEIIQSLLLQYGFSSLLLGLVYGFVIIMIDFQKFPGLFTFYLALFVAMSFSQLVISIYNVFFQSKDLTNYAPLPLETHKVFLSKFLVVAYSSLSFLVPAFILFLLTSIKAHVYVPVAIVISLLLFVFLFALLFELGVLLVFGLVKSPLYKKYQKTMNNVLVFLPNFLMIIAILGINFSTGDSLDQDKAIIPVLSYFFDITTAPFRLKSLLILVVFLALLGLLYLLIKKNILPRLFDVPTPLAIKRRRKNKQGQSLASVLLQYNKGLISDPTLLTQTLFSSVIIPVIILINFTIGSDELKLTQVPNLFAGVAFLAGILFAGMTINGTSLISNIISLDKDNYEFITSLPLQKQLYLKNKFCFAFTIHAVINTLIAILAAVILSLPLLFSVLLLLGSWVGTYLYSDFYFYRDYRLLSLKWTNVSQLFNRGMGNFGTFLSISTNIILLGAACVGYFLLLILYMDLTLWINLIVTCLVLIICLTFHIWIQQRFWKKL